MLLRRLRGLLASIVGGAITGGACGALWGLILVLLPGPKEITVRPDFPGAVMLVPTALSAVVGALSGAAFGILLMVAERGRGVDELRAYRVAAWSALPSIITLRLVGGSWELAAIGGALAAAIGAGATWLAKRGRQTEIEIVTEQVAP